MRRPLGMLKGQHLRHLLAEDDVEHRDQRERDRERDGMDGRSEQLLWQTVKERLDQRRDGRLADPAEPQGRHRDTELSRRDEAVRIVLRPQQHPAEAMTLLDHLLDAASPQADQRKLGGDEERVQKDEYPDRRQPYRDVYDARGSLRAGRPPSRIDLGGHDPRSLDH